jgi:hypothetical protein
MAELLDGMTGDDWGTYVDCEDQFLSYPTQSTWWTPNIFRIYLAEGEHCEYLDVYVCDWDEPRWVMYHLELLAGGTDILVRYSSDVHHFAVAMMNDGRVLYNVKEVKVTLGGCGG